jgi:hypothetical protein
MPFACLALATASAHWSVWISLRDLSRVVFRLRLLYICLFPHSPADRWLFSKGLIGQDIVKIERPEDEEKAEAMQYPRLPDLIQIMTSRRNETIGWRVGQLMFIVLFQKKGMNAEYRPQLGTHNIVSRVSPVLIGPRSKHEWSIVVSKQMHVGSVDFSSTRMKTVKINTLAEHFCSWSWPKAWLHRILLSSACLQDSIDQRIREYTVSCENLLSTSGENVYFQLFQMLCEGSAVGVQTLIVRFWFHCLNNFAILEFHFRFWTIFTPVILFARHLVILVNHWFPLVGRVSSLTILWNSLTRRMSRFRCFLFAGPQLDACVLLSRSLIIFVNSRFCWRLYT